MNRERARELLPVIQAFAEGKEIEILDTSDKSGCHWMNIQEPEWLDDLQYRIKPERRKVWVHFLPSGDMELLDKLDCIVRGCKVVCVEEPE